MHLRLKGHQGAHAVSWLAAHLKRHHHTDWWLWMLQLLWQLLMVCLLLIAQCTADTSKWCLVRGVTTVRCKSDHDNLLGVERPGQAQ